MSRLPLVIFHSTNGELHCDDGWAAAWVMHKRFKGACELYPGVYGRSPPDVSDVVGRDVYLVDFSYKLDMMRELAGVIGKAGSLTVFDHHKTAEEDLGRVDEWIGPDAPKVRVLFDMTRSGSMITWGEMFPGQEPPELLRYIQDGDLWEWKLPGAREVQAAVRSYPQTILAWNELMARSVSSLQAEGTGIRRWFDRQVDALLANRFPGVIAGERCWMANANTVFASELAGRLAELSGAMDFGAVYVDYPTERGWSLRSRNWRDVSEIARKFGGGGHARAAGFSTPRT